MANTVAIKLEVAELDSEARKKWYTVSRELQELTNFVWRHWEAYHTERDSQAEIRECLRLNDEWKAKTKKERAGQKRPKWTVDAWPKEFANRIYHLCTARFPGLNGRVIVLALQKIRGNIVAKKSAGSSLKWWTAILLDRDGRATSLHPQPIPFDRANSKLRSCDEKGRVELVLRIDRIARLGKRGVSTEFAIKLKSGGKRREYAKLVHAALAGEIQYRGSQLVYDWRKKKWFACIVVDKPSVVAAELDESKVVIVRPGKYTNWRVRYNGRTWTIGGRGNHVAHVRKGLLSQRWGRQESYRHAPRRKGRGKDRALVPLFKLSNRWNNFTRSMNDGVTAWVLRWCVVNRVGTIVLVGGSPDRRLATAGKIDNREDSTGWAWHQVEQLLEQKANRAGIAVRKRPFCGGKNQRKVKGGKSLQQTR